MYGFLLGCWQRHQVTEEDLNSFADFGWITHEQAAEIIATPQWDYW